ncbi:CBS domain-containing protein [Desulfotignum balticum]|uniref:CBS domain-containing protein n=1 Tax=Desulfotignum balticum TaxID=115781 RepID=UPI00040C994E|nr:CBS domain-containing protein [Desulfotignum balticum]
MIVKNWMRKNPDIIPSDLSAKAAIQEFETKKVPFLAVVDDGRFKGFIARRDLREAASWTISTQDIFEIQYFNEKLKVRDIMVRKPVTLSIDDSVENAIKKGSRFGRSFLPVMDGEKLVGTLSNRDFTQALSQLLGEGEGVVGVTIELNGDSKTTIKEILEEFFAADVKINGFFTLKNPNNGANRLIIRFDIKYLKKITPVIKEKGYRLLEEATYKDNNIS